MVDLERTFQITIALRWTIFKILLSSAVIRIQRVLHGKEIVQYVQSYKCHEVDQDHSKKLL